jgi:transposase-like protein
MATALQQMEAYGFTPEQIFKGVGMQQYLNAAGGADPQSGLPYAPFVGVNPNTQTALTPEAQGQISMRDSNESIAQSLITAIQQGENSARVANINQAGANQRNNATIAARESGGAGGGTKPTNVPTVSPTVAGAIKKQVTDQAANLGYTLEPSAIDFVATEATRRYQDPESDGFKNVQGAVLSVVDDLANGVLTGVESERQGETNLFDMSTWGFNGPPRTVVKRPTPGQPAAAAGKQPNLANIPGVPAGAKLGKQTAQGWEVFDKSGKVIGHIQE